jgi:predicted AlkP superfamily phosphohydrolase/phosphomutase/tetratricopeptide (TPR) repeat protein
LHSTIAIESMAIERRVTNGGPRRVLLIGWDAADWGMIDPLLAAGLMPTLAALLERGVRGNLRTTQPMLSPILWNTIATGRRAAAHGIAGFTEPVPDGPGIRPVASTSRRCRAIWNLLTGCGCRSNVVGWYASHPAEPIAGTMVSNRLEFGAGESGEAPLPEGVVHPPESADRLARCRVHPQEIDASAVLPFVPDAPRVAARDPDRLGRLRQMLAQTATVQAMATELLATEPWDLTAVYFEGIDRFGHEFMEFHPPRMPQVSEEDFEAYRHCMTGIYRFHDMMLEALLAAAGEGTTVLLVSDHGYWNDERRPDPREGRSGPVEWHRPLGILAAAGPGIRTSAPVCGGGILDIAPTLLQLLGLPAAHDMPGRVLAEILDDDAAAPIERIPTWEEVDGEFGLHPPDLRIDPEASREALAHLVALGYIEPFGDDEEKARRETEDANRLQLAHDCADAGDLEEALRLIGELRPPLADETPVRLLEANCLVGLRRLAEARTLLDALDGAATPNATTGRRVELLRSRIDALGGRVAEALARVEAIARTDGEAASPEVLARIGELRVALSRHAEAEAPLEAALAANPEDAAVLAALARVRLALGDPEAAVDLGLRSASLAFTNPRVHFVLGEAFLALGDHEGAIEALETCLLQAPAWREARESLQRAQRGRDSETR